MCICKDSINLKEVVKDKQFTKFEISKGILFCKLFVKKKIIIKKAIKKTK